MLESVISEIKTSEIKNMTSVPNDSSEKAPASRLEQVQNILKKAKTDNEAREKCRILASKAAVVKDTVNFTSHLCRKDANSNLLNGMTMAIQKIKENIRNKQKEGKHNMNLTF
eukprot:Awhi_evm1s5732